MNKLDEQILNLYQDIIDNGVVKTDRTGTGTKAVFGRQIRHKMSDGFPILTTKKMPFKIIATELLWFLRGETNIKWLVERGCNIWNGDAYKRFKTTINSRIDFNNLDNLEPLYDKGYLQVYGKNDVNGGGFTFRILNEKEFVERIISDSDFADEWGELGPIYGKQWRQWQGWIDVPEVGYLAKCSLWHDQIATLIHQLKTNPDSRRLMVNAWNVAEIGKMVLPPCHYGFQMYTRELNLTGRIDIAIERGLTTKNAHMSEEDYSKWCDKENIPTRSISLMWNQRSVDSFLGLPFNITSYGLLLEIIAKEVNMVPDELIGNLGDTHLYLNHIDQAIEQMGRELSVDERIALKPDYLDAIKLNDIEGLGGIESQEYLEQAKSDEAWENWAARTIILNLLGVPKRTRESFNLPKLKIKRYMGDGLIKTRLIPDNSDERFYEESDFILEGYQSQPPIKAPLSN